MRGSPAEILAWFEPKPVRGGAVRPDFHELGVLNPHECSHLGTECVAKMTTLRIRGLRLTLRVRAPCNMAFWRTGILPQPAHLEQTIAEPLEFSGVGLHSGAPVNMRLLPAPAGSGIVFRRTDLDNFEIPATGRNVAKVSYATSLMRQGVLISTTEHLLSALIGMGVDNVIVEIDNLELPILDGSALPYVEAFLSVGHPDAAPPPRIHPRPAARRGARRRQVHRRLSRVRATASSTPSISLLPSAGRAPASTWPPRPTAASIAPARTFGYKADEQRLRDMGLIRGAGPENAIILGKDGPENGPLRFADEYVRHKVLDLIGDLALAGRRIEGHVVAERAGHAMHTALVSRLLKDRSAWEMAREPIETHEAEQPAAIEGFGSPALQGA